MFSYYYSPAVYMTPPLSLQPIPTSPNSESNTPPNSMGTMGMSSTLDSGHDVFILSPVSGLYGHR